MSNLLKDYMGIISLVFKNIGQVNAKIPEIIDQQDGGSGFIQIPNNRNIVRDQLYNSNSNIQQVQQRRKTDNVNQKFFHIIL